MLSLTLAPLMTFAAVVAGVQPVDRTKRVRQLKAAVVMMATPITAQGTSAPLCML